MHKSPLLDVVVTARPSWARVQTLVHEYLNLNGSDSIRLSLAGPAVSERYGDISKQIPQTIKLHTFSVLGDSDSLGAVALTAANVSFSLISHWTQSRPSAVLVIADRTETLGVSLASSLMQIPLIHLQGGEISGSIDHKIRNANSKLADLHLTTNSRSSATLESIGESRDYIRVVGCPSVDLVRIALENRFEVPMPNAKDIGGVGGDFDLKSDYGIIMFHPDTIHLQENEVWLDGILDLVQTSSLNWYWFWPNPDHGSHAISKKIRRLREQNKLRNARFLINLAPEVFLKLVLQSKIFIGNSSFGIRESSFLGIPVIDLGRRQSGREKSSNVVSIEVYNQETLRKSFNSQIGKWYKPSHLYGDGFAGKKAAEILSNWILNPVLKTNI